MFGQVFRPEMQCTVPLGRRNAVYSPSGPEKSAKLQKKLEKVPQKA